MLRSTAVPIERAWNTWSSRPAEMVFLPLGVRITPLAYADSTRAATLFPPGEGVLYGRHALDGSLVEMDLSHAGTRLAWRYRKAEPFELQGSWRTLKSGEWGLRFWINLCLSAEDGQMVRYDAARKAAIVKVGHRFVALASAADPVQVTGHSSVEALAERYETHGYFETASRSQADRVLALRFNLEMTSENRFGVAVADAEDVAIERAHQVAAREEKEAPISKQTGRSMGALDAIRDVTAWNTVWDEINQRSYTSISRNWNLAKFGGYGVLAQRPAICGHADRHSRSRDRPGKPRGRAGERNAGRQSRLPPLRQRGLGRPQPDADRIFSRLDDVPEVAFAPAARIRL